MNKLNSFNGQFELGQSVLTRVRCINAIAGDPNGGKKLQIELRELKKSKSLLSVLNEEDPRMVGNKAQPAWMMADFSSFQKHFNVPNEVMDKLKALPVSTGIKNMVEGVHFHNVNIVNPTINGVVLRVQIIESTAKPSERAQPKINPGTGEIITHQGQPVYRTSEIILGEPKDVLLVGDKQIVTVAEITTPAIAAAVA